MILATAIAIHGYGTSEGLEKAWDTRGRGRAERSHVEKLNRSKLSKQFSTPVTAEKIRAAAQSVQQLAKVIGGTVTTDSHPFDILLNGTKIGIEVKLFMPGRKHEKATVHGGLKGGYSKERKQQFAKKNGMQKLFLVVHNAKNGFDKSTWHVRRLGDKKDPWADPKDPRTGWSYNTRKMFTANAPEGLKGKLK